MMLATTGLLLGAGETLAASKTWSGAGSDSYWSTGANWGGIAPTNWDTITFSGANRQANTNDIPSLQIGAVTFSTAGWRIASTSQITKTNDFTHNVSGTNVWAADTILINTGSAATKVTANNYPDRLEISGQLSGAGGLTKTAGANGKGSLFLSCPTNTFTGVPSLGTGQTDATRFAPKSTPSSFGAGTGTITIGSTASGYPTTFNYVGDTDGDSDRIIDLQTRDGSSLYFNNSSPNNASLTFNGGWQCRGYNKDGFVYVGGTSTGTNTINSFLNQMLTNNITFTVNGPGTWVLNGPDTLTGNTIVNSGTFVLGSAATLASANVTVRRGAALNVDAIPGGFPLGQISSQSLTAGYNTNNTSPSDVVGSLSLGYYGLINVAGAATAGTLNLSSNLSVAAGAGLIQMDLSDQPVLGDGTNDLILVGGDLDLSSTATLSINPYKGTLATGAPYTVIMYNGNFTGDPANLIVPPPARTLTAALSTNASKELQVTFSPSGIAPANLVWQGLYSMDWAANASQSWLNHGTNDVFMQGDAVTFNDESASSWSVNLVGLLFPSAITVNTTNTFAWQGAGTLGGGSTVTLSKQGTGSLVIATANSESGNTVISAGSIIAGNSSALGTSSIVLGDSDTGSNVVSLLFNSAASLSNPVRISTNGTGLAILGRESGNGGGFNGPIQLERSLVFTNSGAYSGTTLCLVNGNISGQGDVTLVGGGFHKWQGSNSFSGNLNLRDPGVVFQASGSSAIPDTADVNVATGATLVIFGYETINGLNGGGVVRPIQSSYTLSVGGAGGSGNFSGIISNNTETAFAVLSLRKVDAGIQVLSGDNSLSTGSTTVAGGTLAINNTTGSGTPLGAVTVQALGTLAGNGIVSSSSNNITVDGSLSVGNLGDTNGAVLTIDNATFATSPGSLTINSGSLDLDLFSGAGAGDNTGTPAAADQLNATCAVHLNAGSRLNVSNPRGLTAWAVGDKWKIIRWGSAPSGTFGTLSLPYLGPSLTWDISALYTDGVIAVITRPPIPPISFTSLSGSLTLTWPGNGVLQAAPTVLGVYTNVVGATSPFVITNFDAPSMFYRLQIPW